MCLRYVIQYRIADPFGINTATVIGQNFVLPARRKKPQSENVYWHDPGREYLWCILIVVNVMITQDKERR